MTETVNLTIEGDIALVVIDHAPVNALSFTIRAGIEDAIARANADPAVKAIVIHGAGRAFIAGADIREFGKPPKPPVLTDVVSAIENSTKPTIAAIHGFALGGGLEIAMGAHYRVALPGAKLGLPEVNIGVIPGASGTQRLPRLIPMDKALDMITSGNPADAKNALADGLIDELSTAATPREAGIAFARKVIDEKRGIRLTRDAAVGTTPARADRSVFDRYRKKMADTAKGQVAQLKAIDCVEKGLDMSFDDALLMEREAFRELLDTPQRDALIHVFFAERAVSDIPEARAAKPRPLAEIGVIGGGTMGSGIAVSALNAGFTVCMVEHDAASAERGRGNVEKIYRGNVDRGRMTEEAKAATLARFSVSTDFASLAQADMIIEAVFEDMEVKKTVFQKLDAVAKPGAVLATNTSYLDINQIADATTRPQDVIGLHFFSPAHIMKLLEIVVPAKTATDVVATGFELGRKLKKIAVRAGVCDGFIGNRILAAYREAADAMVERGASPYDIDRVLVEFGFPMGPYAVSDLAGLDIGFATRKRKAPSRLDRPYPTFPDLICERGWFGQKTGRGFYLYPQGSRHGVPGPDVLEIIAEARKARGLVAQGLHRRDDPAAIHRSHGQ